MAWPLRLIDAGCRDPTRPKNVLHIQSKEGITTRPFKEAGHLVVSPSPMHPFLCGRGAPQPHMIRSRFCLFRHDHNFDVRQTALKSDSASTLSNDRREDARTRYRPVSARFQALEPSCPPVGSNHLSLRPTPGVSRRGDNMLDGRSREPDFPDDARRLEAGRVTPRTALGRRRMDARSSATRAGSRTCPPRSTSIVACTKKRGRLAALGIHSCRTVVASGGRI